MDLTSGTIVELAGARVLVAAIDVGAPYDAGTLIGDALSAEAAVVAIPVERLSPAFLDLSTRLAGEVLQKFVNYGRRVAIAGDVGAAVSASQALADFVRESNRGRHVWFVADLDALAARLEAGG